MVSKVVLVFTLGDKVVESVAQKLVELILTLIFNLFIRTVPGKESTAEEVTYFCRWRTVVIDY